MVYSYRVYFYPLTIAFVAYNIYSIAEYYGYTLSLKQLKKLSDLNWEKDLKIIKILHDIQNPVYSINLSLGNDDQFNEGDSNQLNLNSGNYEQSFIESHVEKYHNKQKFENQTTGHLRKALQKDSNFEINTLLNIDNTQIVNSTHNNSQMDSPKDLYNVIISEVNNLQSTLHSIKYEMKIQNDISYNETYSLISIYKFVNYVIKQNIKYASNGGNKILLNIPSNSILSRLKIKRQSAELIITNLLRLNIKHIFNGIIGIKLTKDDFDNPESTNKKYTTTTVGSQRNSESEYFVVEITNSSMKLKIEDQTLMDVFTFNTFIKACGNAGIILSYKDTFEYCKLYIPYQKQKDNDSKFIDQVSLMYHENNVINNNLKYDHECNTAIIVEDNNNILKFYGKIMSSAGIKHKLFLNGKYALDYIKSINCDHKCKILVYTDFNMPYMDGLQLARQIRNLNNGHHFKIVMISAEENYQNNFDNFLDEIFIKPIEASKLISIYNEFLNNVDLNYIKMDLSN